MKEFVLHTKKIPLKYRNVEFHAVFCKVTAVSIIRPLYPPSVIHGA